MEIPSSFPRFSELPADIRQYAFISQLTPETLSQLCKTNRAFANICYNWGWSYLIQRDFLNYEGVPSPSNSIYSGPYGSYIYNLSDRLINNIGIPPEELSNYLRQIMDISKIVPLASVGSDDEENGPLTLNFGNDKSFNVNIINGLNYREFNIIYRWERADLEILISPHYSTEYNELITKVIKSYYQLPFDEIRQIGSLKNLNNFILLTTPFTQLGINFNINDLQRNHIKLESPQGIFVRITLL